MSDEMQFKELLQLNVDLAKVSAIAHTVRRCLAIMENESDGSLSYAVFKIRAEFGLEEKI